MKSSARSAGQGGDRGLSRGGNLPPRLAFPFCFFRVTGFLLAIFSGPLFIKVFITMLAYPDSDDHFMLYLWSMTYTPNPKWNAFITPLRTVESKDPVRDLIRSVDPDYYKRKSPFWFAISAGRSLRHWWKSSPWWSSCHVYIIISKKGIPNCLHKSQHGGYTFVYIDYQVHRYTIQMHHVAYNLHGATIYRKKVSEKPFDLILCTGIYKENDFLILSDHEIHKR